MQFKKQRVMCKPLVGVWLLVFLAGCAADRAQRAGERLYAEGRYEESVEKLEEAMNAEPESGRYRASYRLYRSRAVDVLLRDAQKSRDSGNVEDAEATLRRILIIEPGNDRAMSGLTQLVRDRAHAKRLVRARDALRKGDLTQADSQLAALEEEGATGKDVQALHQELTEARASKDLDELVLQPGYDKPVSLDFRNAPVGGVLEALTRSTGVNFILDRDVRADLRTTVVLKQTPVDEAIDFILQTGKLEKKVLNKNTVLIYPGTPEKLKEYQELLVRSFYLGRADVKQVQASLKTLLGLRYMVVDEKLNLLIVRDTPDTMRLVEKIVAMQDIFEPEVMLELEVMEVTRDRLTELGIEPPSGITLTPLASASNLTLQDFKHLNDSKLGVSSISASVNLRRETSDVSTLANPRIRAKNREKAKVMIGDKVPVVTTTSTSTGFVSESVQYLDVGLKLDVEPTIYLRNEVAIKVGLEVSNIVKEVTTQSGSLAYQVGTRNASTLLQLKDGETQILAGLISSDESNTASKIPGLGDLPLLGRLFSNNKDEHNRTEIVLAITPRIVRMLDRPDASESTFWSGSEAYPRTRPIRLSSKPAPATPDVAGEVKAAMPLGSTIPFHQTLEPQASRGTSVTKEPTSISFAWKGPQQVKAGETFEVSLLLKTDGGVSSLPLQLGYDSKALQLLDIREGGFFRDEETRTAFARSIDAAAGKAFVSVSRSGGEGAQGEGSILTLTFKATKLAERAAVSLLAATPVTVSQRTPSVPVPAALEIEVLAP